MILKQTNKKMIEKNMAIINVKNVKKKQKKHRIISL